MITPLDILSLETWILLVSLLALIRYYIHQKWQVLKKLNIPHDPPSILGIGNLSAAFKNIKTMFKMDIPNKKRFGKVYGSYSGLQPRVCVYDPVIIKEIYIKEFSNFRDRQRTFSKVNGPLMNNILTAVSGDQWKRIRNTLTPTFSTSKLKDMTRMIELCTDQTVVNLLEIAERAEGRFDTKEVFGRLSMDVICSAAFSVNAHTQDGEGKRDQKTIEMAKSFFDRDLFNNPLVLLFFLFPWTENVAKLLKYGIFPKVMTSYFEAMMDVLIQNLSSSGSKQRTDIIQLMLKSEITENDVKNGAEKGMTRDEIKANAIVMIIAGYETTANSILFLAYNLAVHKDVQERLFEEINDTIEEYGELNYESINSMKYLTMCMNESMRLYPATPSNSRFCEKEITVGGIRIPAGIHVDIPIYGLSHDEEFWDDPYDYIPQRMEDMTKIDPMLFQPFGGGPRNCIGMRFAIMEVKMAICKILRKFHLDTCEDTPKPPLEQIFRGSMQPKEKIFLKVLPRNEKVH